MDWLTCNVPPLTFPEITATMALRLLSLSLLSTAAAAGQLVSTQWNGTSYGCKCYVGDDCWPKAEEWSQLNSSVGGALLVDVPPGAVCHNTFDGPLGVLQTYNADECANTTALFAQEQWTSVFCPS